VNNTRAYAPGTSVPFHVDMEAHHTGFAVSFLLANRFGAR
jgi:hypothetical protein